MYFIAQKYNVLKWTELFYIVLNKAHGDLHLKLQKKIFEGDKIIWENFTE